MIAFLQNPMQTQQSTIGHTVAMAKLNEEALQNMFLVDELVRRDKEMRETLESLRRESQVHQCEAKALM